MHQTSHADRLRKSRPCLRLTRLNTYLSRLLRKHGHAPLQWIPVERLVHHGHKLRRCGAGRRRQLLRRINRKRSGRSYTHLLLQLRDWASSRAQCADGAPVTQRRKQPCLHCSGLPDGDIR